MNLSYINVVYNLIETNFVFFVFQFSFDLQLEKWGVDVEVLKEPAITWRFIGWTEDWEKEKFKDSGAVARTMFINKYNDTVF